MEPQLSSLSGCVEISCLVHLTIKTVKFTSLLWCSSKGSVFLLKLEGRGVRTVAAEQY